MTEYSLDLHVSSKTADLYVDFDKKVLQINWKGKVDFEDYKAVLLKGLALTEQKGVVNVVLNRLDLEELSVECRVWLKNDFLKFHAKPFIPALSKVATIESKSTLGRIYTNTITKSVSLIYPNLSFKSFPSEQSAYEWIALDELTPAGTGSWGRSKKKKVILIADRPPARAESADNLRADEKNKDRFLARFIHYLFGSRKEDL